MFCIINFSKLPCNYVSLVCLLDLGTSGGRSLSVCIICFISVSFSPFLFISVCPCQRPPDQSVDGCHGYEQSAAAAVWVYLSCREGNSNHVIFQNQLNQTLQPPSALTFGTRCVTSTGQVEIKQMKVYCVQSEEKDRFHDLSI